MRNAILGGFLGVLCGTLVLAACGGSRSGPAALTQAELDAQVLILQQQIDALTARLDAHEPTPDAHHPPTPKLGLNYCIALAGQFPSRNLIAGDVDAGLAGIDPLLGSIGLFAGNFAPRGWAFCEGQDMDIASHSALFSILGTTYGGDGRVTFKLPDLRARVPVHPDGTIQLGTKAD